MNTELINRLELGASISRDRNLNLDFAEIADEAAKALKTNIIDEYATWARTMWMSDTLEERDLTIMSLGLPGETGEVVELLKKRVRDGNIDLMNLKKELGDVLYYWAMLCVAFGFKPSEVIEANKEKLNSRQSRGVMHGSGDDR